MCWARRLTLGHQHLGHAVIQAGHDREGLERLFVDTLRLGILAALVQQAAQRRIDPRLRAAGEDALRNFSSSSKRLRSRSASAR
jgi:hypothetical protein